MLLLDDDWRVLEHAQVRPGVRLAEHAEKLALDRPQTHRELGRRR